MHEFGHNLGLCHPSDNNKNCPGAYLPPEERYPGKTAMGTPADDRGHPLRALKHALRLALDYLPVK